MHRKLMYVTLLVSIVLSALACSQSNPVAPLEYSQEKITEADNHDVWGYYTLIVDPAVPSVEIAESRLAAGHLNVKPFVSPPACTDCLTVTPTGPFAGNILPLEITLKNPKPITGFDVRGIIISNDIGVGLANADDYTMLFDDGGAVILNPYKAYAKINPDRSFGPGEIYIEHYDLWLASFGKIAVIDYAIDASWPSRAKEPYQVDAPVIGGDIDSTGQNMVPITIDIYASGNDVTEVWFNCSSMGFAGELPLTFVSGNTWSINFKNTPMAVEGQYTCIVRASTASSANYLYDYFTITVVPGTPMVSLANDVQPIFDAKCVDCHDAGEPPDLRPGYTWGELVNQDSYQSSVKLITPGDPYLSYNQAKIRGTHKSAPYSGFGKAMPWEPPFVTDAELLLIDTWIEQGALNN